MTEEVFNEVYRDQGKKEDKSFNDDDTVDNDFEQGEGYYA
jgi:hypothetical protein